MIIEKTVVDNNRYDVNLKDYVADGELTVTITLNEYRDLLRDSIEKKLQKEKLDWLDQYNRANRAESRVKELEVEVQSLYKRLAVNVESNGESDETN